MYYHGVLFTVGLGTSVPWPPVGGSVVVRFVIPFEEQPEVGGSDLIARVEAEVAEEFERTLACAVDVGRLGFDLDVLAEVGHGVESDRVLPQAEAFAFFLDDGRRLEPERAQDLVHRFVLVDARLVFATRLGVGVDERSLVRDERFVPVLSAYATDPERLVGLGERAVGSVVVRVALDHRAE